MSQSSFTPVDSLLVPRIAEPAPRLFRRPTLRSSSRYTHHPFPQPPRGNSATVEQVSTVAASSLSAFIKDELSTSDRPELTSARSIISAGRALAREVQEVILPFADKLGAAVGASRAAASL